MPMTVSPRRDLGDEGGETAAGVKSVAQPVGFAGAHRVAGILAFRQKALEPHQCRNVTRLRRAHAKWRHILMSSTLPILPVEFDGGVGSNFAHRRR